MVPNSTNFGLTCVAWWRHFLVKKRKKIKRKEDTIINNLFKGTIYDRYFKLFFKFKPALEDFINSYYKFIGEDKRFGFADVTYQALITSDNFKARDMFADIRCTLDNGEIILLEAYTSFTKEEYNKSYSYTSRTYANQLEYLGENSYSDMKKVSCLNIMSGNFRNINENLVNSYIPKNKLTNKIIDDGNTEMILVRLDKAKDYLVKFKHEERFIRWLRLLKATSIKEMEEIGRNDAIMEQSIGFLKWYRQEYDSFEKEMREREQRGISIGEARGEKSGIKKNQLKTAKNLLKLGIDSDTIIKATGISKTALKELQN